MKLSVIMPVFNEKNTVKKAVERVLRQPFVHQLVIVNDGSTDGSKKIINSIKSKKVVTVNNNKNLGKGSAVRQGLLKVTGDYIIINDADLEYDPKDIKELIIPIKEKKAKVVYGSRFKGPHTNMFFWHYVGNNFLNLLVNVLFNTTLSDMETCYKLVPTDLIKSFKLTANDFGFEPEVTCKILKTKHRIYEVPISYSGRGYDEGKKLHWTQGIRAVQIILKERFL
ncbi:glycosyltransferase family 2 protein [Patescibacteria group bacterium]